MIIVEQINIRTKRKTTVADLMEFGKRLGLIKKLEKINTKKALEEVEFIK